MLNVSNSKSKCDTRLLSTASCQPNTYISGFATRGVLIGLSLLGLDTELLCAPLGWSATELMNPAARVPRSVVWFLFSEAERVSGDPSIGLRVAQAMPAGAAGGTLSQLANVSGTGLIAIRNFAKYCKLLANGLEVRLSLDPTRVLMEFIPAEQETKLVRHAMEALLAGVWKVIDESMIKSPVLKSVSFRHLPPPQVDLYQRFFGCSVTFRSSSYCLQFPLEALQKDMVIGEQTRTKLMLQSLVESELRTIAPEFTVMVGEQVRIAIEQQELPTISLIAKRIGVGQRTLQRRLQKEGASFREVSDRERRNLALRILRDPGARIIDAGLAIGFNDATSFAKAFRRWTGECPTDYQARSAKKKT